MKLETSEGEREGWKSFYHSGFDFVRRLLRDIDTLLAEVNRLRAERRPFSDALAQKVIDEQVKTIDRLLVKLAAAAPPAPPIPAEVEEIASTLRWLSGDDSGKFTNGDKSVLLRAASLLSRWPGGWRPISTAPKDGTNILLTDGAEVASGYWAEKTENALTMRPACWMVHWVIGKPGTHPTHWQPIPEPPNE